MMLNVERYRYRTRKKRKKWPFLLIFLLAIGLGAAWWLRSQGSLKLRAGSQPQGTALTDLWNAQLYDDVIARCQEKLQGEPLDFNCLAYMGFSYFYKAVSEAALEEKIPYLDASIVALRRANLVEKGKWASEVAYVLGKAYFQKGKYYYDLAAKYLTRALSLGYEGSDIYDYLGLAYIQLGRPEKGLEYFLLALEKNPTDLLYLTVGQSYYELKKLEEAEEYLIRAVNKTDDPSVEKKSRFLLGQIYYEQKRYFKAEREYQQIIALDSRSADAHFYLGEIYNEMNDPVKARAQWRKALIIDPAHYGAKLRYYR